MTLSARLLSFLALVVGLMLSGAGCAFPQPGPNYDAADAVSLRLEQEVPGGRRVCSGWVIEHHAVVTDEHCIVDDGPQGWSADGRKMRVYGVIRDNNDHVILLTDLYFARTASVGPRPKRGDEVFTLGNPDGIADVLLLGRVAGFVDAWTVDFGYGLMTFTDLVLLDSKDYRGCSGAAVFDSQGRVVAMVNGMYANSGYNEGWWLTGAFSLKFTAKQYQAARRFLPRAEQLLRAGPTRFALREPGVYLAP